MKRNENARNWGSTVLIVLAIGVIMSGFVFGFIQASNSFNERELTQQELYLEGFGVGQKFARFEELISIALLEKKITNVEAERLVELYASLSEDILGKEEVSKKTSKEFNKALKRVYIPNVNVSQESLLITPTKIDILGFTDGMLWSLCDKILTYEYIIGHITQAEYDEYSQKADEYWEKFIENPSHEVAEEFLDYANSIMIKTMEDILREPQFPSAIEGTQMGAFTLFTIIFRIIGQIYCNFKKKIIKL